MSPQLVAEKLQQQPFAQSGLMIDMDGGKVTWGAYTLPITENKGNMIVFQGDTEERTDSAPPIVLHYSTSGTMDRSSGSLALIEQEHTVGTSATYNLQCNPRNPVF